MNIPQLFEQLIRGQSLDDVTMQAIMQDCMQGKLSDCQIAVFLALMRAKGETVAELTAAALIMQQMAHTIDLGDNLVDIVGTGGDGKNTFNISTLSSVITAAAGFKVAKHGNYSVSSRSGSADLLQAAGVNLVMSDKQLQQCLQQTNICFLFGPHFHQAMSHARHARKEMGIRSFFNLLGPLVNPANVRHQVVGVFDPRWQQPLAEVLANLGSERALVITSDDGLDEISIAASTKVIEYRDGTYSSWTINPNDYQCDHPTLEPIIVHSAAESLNIIQSVLQGKSGPARDIAVLNSAAAIYCASDLTYQQAIEKARHTLDSGAALRCFQQLIAFSQGNPL